MSALIPGEQRQDVLLHCAPMEDIDKCMDFGSIFFTNGQVAQDITSRINLARPAFPRLQLGIWSWREMALRTMHRDYQAVVRSILLYGCETWPVRVADERRLEVFDNDSIRRILRVRRRDCVPSVELRRRSCKEGSAGLDMPQDVPKVSLLRTFS